jgi:hypothetical protein
MPWPAPIPALLSRRDGRPAEALRWSLRALRGCLQAALDEGPDDPGEPEARALLAELDALLGSPAATTSADPPPAAAQPDEPSTPRLSPLARAIAADTALQAELGDEPLRGGDDGAIWGEARRRLLRASPPLADAWGLRCLEEALGAGARPDDSLVTPLPVPEERTLYPGLAGAIRTLGLRTAPSAPLDPRVAAPPEDADLKHLAGLVSAALWFVANDPELHHCLEGVYRFGVVPLAGDQRDRYVDELLRRWRRARDRALVPSVAPKTWLKEYLKERIELDEALHSLIYLPPAAPDSWWGRFQGQARLALFRARDRVVQAGCPARLQRLAGSFPAVSDLVDDDNLHVDHGTPGEIVACLRVYARIDGEDLRGRVLYRSL